MNAGLAKRLFTLPWLTVPPIGFAALSRLVIKAPAVAPTKT
jgi:arsenite-transporting ATPase